MLRADSGEGASMMTPRRSVRSSVARADAPVCSPAVQLLALGFLVSCALLTAGSWQLRARPAPGAAATLSTPAAPLALDSGPAPLVAIPDLHGDLLNALRSLQLSGVADAKGAWTGGTTHLVQTGDIVDRGDDSIAILELFWRLRDEARAAGGDVTLLLGNHEIWAMSGEHTYASEVELSRLGEASGTAAGASALAAGAAAWDARFGPDGDLGRVLAATHSAAALAGAGACRTLFVHAGLAPAFAAGGLPADGGPGVVRALNARLAAALAAAHGPQLPAADAALFGDKGPFWLRALALGPERAACVDVARTLRAVGARRMVVGHTVQPGGARTRCGGSLVLLDTGISAAYYGKAAAWECREEQGAAALELTGRRQLDTPPPPEEEAAA